jgi:hypothetical protein
MLSKPQNLVRLEGLGKLKKFNGLITPINSACYSEMVPDRLKLAIRSKCRGLLLKGVVLLHNDISPYIAAHTVETLWKLKSDEMANLCIVIILPFLTIICLVHSKRH